MFINEPAHEESVLPQSLYYMSADSKTVLLCSLAWAFSDRLCDKYPFLMCWLKYDIY